MCQLIKCSQFGINRKHSLQQRLYLLLHHSAVLLTLQLYCKFRLAALLNKTVAIVNGKRTQDALPSHQIIAFFALLRSAPTPSNPDEMAVKQEGLAASFS